MGHGRILLGVIGRPHGVRGQLRVHSYTARPEDLATYSPLADAQGRRLALRWTGTGVAEISLDQAGTLQPVRDRAQAERLTNTQLFADRAALPPPEPDEFYLADLIGLTAITPDGTTLGKVTLLHDYGAGASLEITSPLAATPIPTAPLIVPFTRACIPTIDLAAGRITVCPPHERIAAPPNPTPDTPTPNTSTPDTSTP